MASFWAYICSLYSNLWQLPSSNLVQIWMWQNIKCTPPILALLSLAGCMKKFNINIENIKIIFILALLIVFLYNWERANNNTRQYKMILDYTRECGIKIVFQWKLHKNLIQYCIVGDFKYLVACVTHWDFLKWPTTRAWRDPSPDPKYRFKIETQRSEYYHFWLPIFELTEKWLLDWK